MFEVAEKFEECMELSEINVHLQFWHNITGSSLDYIFIPQSLLGKP